ncbi:MAG: hypothetical protein AAGF95_22635 [Chloroflexota bacterium]
MKMLRGKVVLGIMMLLMAFSVSIGTMPHTVEAQGGPIKIYFVGYSNKNLADSYTNAIDNMNQFSGQNSLVCAPSRVDKPNWRMMSPWNPEDDGDYNPAYAFNIKLTGVCAPKS